MDRPPFTPEQRRLAVALALIVTIIALETMSVAVVLPVVERDLGQLALYGWVGSAFTLAQLVGIVVAGRWCDRASPVIPLQVGMTCFVAGLLAGSLAPSMGVLVAARALQGLGAGMAPAVAYVCIGRAFDQVRRPRMFAVLATAWIVPSLAGPALAPVVAERFGWRWVFAGLIPFCLVGGLLAIRPVRLVGEPAVAIERRSTGAVDAMILAAGAAMALAGLGAMASWWGPPLVVGGLAVGARPFRRLTPPGTLTARPGLAAACAVKGLLTFSFFGADYFVAYGLVNVRATSTVFAGAVVAAGSFTWTAAAWTQERLVARTGPRRLVIVGLGVVAAGYVVMLMTLSEAVPLAVAFLGTALAGFGIGLSYSPLSQAALLDAPPDAIGASTSAVQLCDTLGVSLGIGVAGVIVSATHGHRYGDRGGVAVAWLMCIGVALASMIPARGVHGADASPHLPNP